MPADSANFPAEAVRAAWMRTSCRSLWGHPARTTLPQLRRMRGMARRSILKGEDSASGSRLSSRVYSKVDWETSTLLRSLGTPRARRAVPSAVSREAAHDRGSTRFHFAYSPVHDAALNEELTMLGVEVTPLQAHDFADAKSEALRHHDHRPVRFRQARQNRLECFVGEDDGPLAPFGRIFDTHHPDGMRRSLNSSQRAAHSKMTCITPRICGFVLGDLFISLNQPSIAIGCTCPMRYSPQRGLMCRLMFDRYVFRVE